VVLPLPEGPAIATKLSAFTSRSTRSKTRRGRPPLMYSFDRPTARIMLSVTLVVLWLVSETIWEYLGPVLRATIPASETSS
jgi:hypothetical protein